MTKSKPRKSLREIHRDATREHLVAAARTVFERSGYIGATVEDIISESGVSRATFYAHFAGKAELIDAVIASMSGEIDAVWYEFLDALLSDTEPALRGWALTAIEWYHANAGLVPVLEQVTAAEPQRRANVGRFYDRLTELVEPYLQRFPPEIRERQTFRFRILAVQVTTVFYRMPIEQTTPEMRGVLADELAHLWYPVLSLAANGAMPDSLERGAPK